MPERLLVTGSGGFIGQALVRALEGDGRWMPTLLTSGPQAGFRVIDPRMQGPLYGFADADLAAEQFDTIIHLGGFTPKSGAEANDVDGSASNIANTWRLMRALPRPRRLIFASTLDVYGAATPPISEATPCAPASLYGRSKLFCEHMLQAWANETGAELQILRIGHIYGPGEGAYRKLIPTVIRNLLAGSAPVIVSDGAELRSFLYIDDAVRMILRAAGREAVEGPINLVSSRAASVRQIVDMLCNIHRDRSGAIVAPLVKAEAPAYDLTFDPTRLHVSLGRESVELREGLEAEYDHFRALGA